MDKEMRTVAVPPAQPNARAKRSRFKQELRPASAFAVHARTAGKRGRSCGESHIHARHSDAAVDHALDLHAAGMPKRQVARELGIARSTVWHWIRGTRRAPPMRLVATRRPPSFELKELIGLSDLAIPKPSTDSDIT